MKKYIPLTLSQILDKDVNLYVRLRFYRNFIIQQNINLESGKPKTILTLFDFHAAKSLTNTAMGELLGITRTCWAEYKDSLVAAQMFIGPDEQFSLMPFGVFDKFMEWLEANANTIKAKETLLRFYCYVYFQSGVFDEKFQSSQEQMAIELGTTRTLVSRRLKLLRDAGWLVRKGTFKFTGDNTWSYQWGIPEEHRPADIFN